ncbi:copper amine oxidase N-terminal domain-containing protein [Fictibacillus sp. NPDC058756]|uniref:copper amine oxidase N-terminal domain-containing protein n=1 Tax=Fictibacillus sp. NPDC058756 TaxID=3346625 RepID=UPI0036A02ACA
MKRILIFLFTFFIVFGLSSITQAADNIKVQINGSLVDFDAQPFAEDGRVLVPLRGVAEEMGAEVNWYPATNGITIKNGMKYIHFKLNSKLVLNNGEDTIIDVAPAAKNGRAFLPLRFIGEQFGAEVKWSPKDQTAYIFKGELTTLLKPFYKGMPLSEIDKLVEKIDYWDLSYGEGSLTAKTKVCGKDALFLFYIKNHGLKNLQIAFEDSGDSEELGKHYSEMMKAELGAYTLNKETYYDFTSEWNQYNKALATRYNLNTQKTEDGKVSVTINKVFE